MNNVALTLPTTFQNGWARLTLLGVNSQSPRGLSSFTGTELTTAGVVTLRNHTFIGLPVTGFMARSFKNATLPCTTTGGAAATCSVLFESTFAHGYSTVIAP